MNVAIVTETFPPELNGVALTVQKYTNYLVEAGFDVHLVRPRQKFDVAIPESVHEHLVPGLKLPLYGELRFGLPVSKRLCRIFTDYNVEAAYIATEGPLGWAALRSARANGLRVVSGLHTRFDHYAAHYGLSLAKPLVQGYMRRFHNRCQLTLVPTKGMREDFSDAGYQNLEVLTRAIDNERFHPRQRDHDLRASWGLLDDDLAVLYVGRIAAEKNLALVARAFAAIEHREPRARMVVVGDGPQLARMRAEHPRFMYAGRRTGEELARYYASADMFVFPSLTDTYGNVVPEALASGLPVVAFDRAAAGELVTYGENGFLAPVADEERFVRDAVILADLAMTLPDVHRNARLSVANMSQKTVQDSFIHYLAPKRVMAA